MNKPAIEVLDCTVRDGGYVNNWNFPEPMVRDIYRRLSKAGVDFFEIGFRDSSPDSPLWRRCPEDLLKGVKGNAHGAKLSVLVDFGKADADDFVNGDESAIEMVRIAVHKNKVRDALVLAEKIKAKNYLASMQLMGYPQYSDDERREVLKMLQDYPPDYVYVADSYGSLIPDDVRSLVEPLVEQRLFKVGFHPHNNLQLAFANTIEAMKAGIDIVDSTLYGMGRGAGNLATETLMAFLQKQPQNASRFNLIQTLLCVDLYMLRLRSEFEWGYQLPYMLSGMCECHPSYARAMVDSGRYTVDDVWRALNYVKQENPVGFDRPLLEKLLDGEMFEYKYCNADMEDSSRPAEEPPCPVPPPAYQDRHAGRTFLVLANGPNLGKFKNEIDEFIKKYDPVILGANYLGDLFHPHYHAFVNKKRFVKYIDTVSPESSLLLSCYFPAEFIGEYTSRSYEPILFYQGPRDTLSIENGIVSNDCTSVSMLMIAVASVMGATEVFVAGMDGHLLNGSQGPDYFYQESDKPKSAEFRMMLQNWGERTLELLDSHLEAKSGSGGVHIITPSTFERYYRGIRSLI